MRSFPVSHIESNLAGKAICGKSKAKFSLIFAGKRWEAECQRCRAIFGESALEGLKSAAGVGVRTMERVSEYGIVGNAAATMSTTVNGGYVLQSIVIAPEATDEEAQAVCDLLGFTGSIKRDPNCHTWYTGEIYCWASEPLPYPQTEEHHQCELCLEIKPVSQVYTQKDGGHVCKACEDYLNDEAEIRQLDRSWTPAEAVQAINDREVFTHTTYPCGTSIMSNHITCRDHRCRA